MRPCGRESVEAQAGKLRGRMGHGCAMISSERSQPIQTELEESREAFPPFLPEPIAFEGDALNELGAERLTFLESCARVEWDRRVETKNGEA